VTRKLRQDGVNELPPDLATRALAERGAFERPQEGLREFDAITEIIDRGGQLSSELLALPFDNVQARPDVASQIRAIIRVPTNLLCSASQRFPSNLGTYGPISLVMIRHRGGFLSNPGELPMLIYLPDCADHLHKAGSGALRFSHSPMSSSGRSGPKAPTNGRKTRTDAGRAPWGVSLTET
jgi:hypothetical protein